MWKRSLKKPGYNLIADGCLFERSAIEREIAKTGKCPVTSKPLRLSEVIPLRLPSVHERCVRPSQALANGSARNLLRLLESEFEDLLVENQELRKEINTLGERVTELLYFKEGALETVREQSETIVSLREQLEESGPRLRTQRDAPEHSSNLPAKRHRTREAETGREQSVREHSEDNAHKSDSHANETPTQTRSAEEASEDHHRELSAKIADVARVLAKGRKRRWLPAPVGRETIGNWRLRRLKPDLSGARHSCMSLVAAGRGRKSSVLQALPTGRDDSGQTTRAQTGIDSGSDADQALLRNDKNEDEEDTESFHELLPGLLVTGDSKGSVWVWRADQELPCARLEGHKGAVTCTTSFLYPDCARVSSTVLARLAAKSADSSPFRSALNVFSGGVDGTLRYWRETAFSSLEEAPVFVDHLYKGRGANVDGHNGVKDHNEIKDESERTGGSKEPVTDAATEAVVAVLNPSLAPRGPVLDLVNSPVDLQVGLSSSPSGMKNVEHARLHFVCDYTLNLGRGPLQKITVHPLATHAGVCYGRLPDETFSSNAPLSKTVKNSGGFSIVDLIGGRLVRHFGGNDEPSHDLVFNPDGSLVFTAPSAPKILVWDARVPDPANAFKSSLESPISAIPLSLDVSENGYYLVAGYEEGHVAVWDCRKCAIVYKYQLSHKVSKQIIRNVRFDYSGQHIFVTTSQASHVLSQTSPRDWEVAKSWEASDLVGDTSEGLGASHFTDATLSPIAMAFSVALFDNSIVAAF